MVFFPDPALPSSALILLLLLLLHWWQRKRRRRRRRRKDHPWLIVVFYLSIIIHLVCCYCHHHHRVCILCCFPSFRNDLTSKVPIKRALKYNGSVGNYTILNVFLLAICQLYYRATFYRNVRKKSLCGKVIAKIYWLIYYRGTFSWRFYKKSLCSILSDSFD